MALIVSEHTLDKYPMMIRNLLLGFASESVQVAIVCPPSSDIDAIISGPVEVIRHPDIDLPFIERFSRASLVRRLGEFAPAVLHCLCPRKAALAAYLARSLDLPYVLTINALQKRRRSFVGSPKHCARIIVPTRTVGANIAKISGRSADKIEQINMGTFVGDKSICFSQVSRIATMVLVHPFDSADDFENVFSAIRHMLLDGYEFMTLIMGYGPGESDLRDLLAAFDLLKTVTIVPPMRPCRSVLNAGDIFIQPRSWAAFNPFLLEAMSAGLAVAACAGGVDDLIVENETAVVFDPDDELSIMAALKRLLGKREFARTIARQAQQHIRENHSVSGMIAATVKTYRDACLWYENAEE
ncbi:MAG: glycosyltransferase family 4 protein [Sedimentisphaerales bacterium]|nr:glycosyltransferase family 4 protein [Sedimentisphaerales bacterium]